MTDDSEIGERLRQPFPVDDISWKPQSVKGNRALAVAYIDARNVMDRLDEVFGCGGWQDDYTVLNDGCVVCVLRCRIGGEWIAKTDTGSPSEQPDGGDRLKAAFSDALKRAGVKFGIGRYLYSLPMQWCEYDTVKRQFSQTPGLPQWARPQPQQQRPKSADSPQPVPPQPTPKTDTPPVQAKRASTDNMQLRASFAAKIGSAKNAAELQSVKADFKKDASEGKFSNADVAKIVNLVEQRERQLAGGAA